MFASLLLLAVAPATAGDDHGVSLLAMDDFAGVSTTVGTADDYVADGYKQVVRELGVSLAASPTAPAETLGVNGFAVLLGTGMAFIHTGTVDGAHPAGWDLADADETPPLFLYMPTVEVQKGLPASLELDARFGWVGGTDTGLVGLRGRWGVVEGFRQLPDLALDLGYTAYLGNDELELGVMNMGATLGYTLPFGVTQGIHQAQFSPFVGIGLERIHAAPRVDLTDTGLEGRLPEVSGYASSEVFDKQFAPLTVNGGFRIVNGDYAATISVAYSPQVLATVHAGIGFVY